MHEYPIDDIAQAGLDSVGGVCISHFARLGDSAKGRVWANRLYREYRERIAALKSDPYRYGRCLVYPFGRVETRYRSFTVGWFTVFYTVEAGTFTVRHIRTLVPTSRPFARISGTVLPPLASLGYQVASGFAR